MSGGYESIYGKQPSPQEKELLQNAIGTLLGDLGKQQTYDAGATREAVLGSKNPLRDFLSTNKKSELGDEYIAYAQQFKKDVKAGKKKVSPGLDLDQQAYQDFVNQLDDTKLQTLATKTIGSPVKRISDVEGFKTPEQQAAEQYQQEVQKNVDPIKQQFQQLLSDTLAMDYKTAGIPDADAIARARTFVDDTFAKQARAGLEDQLTEFESSRRAQAAALGREPTLDRGTQGDIYATSMRGLRDLELERGARVAQTADVFGYQRPMEMRSNQLQFGSQGLNQLEGIATSRSGFLSDLATRAQQNKLALLGLNTGGVLDYNYRERQPAAIEKKPGAFDYITGGVGAVGGLAQGAGSLIGGMKK